MEIIGVCGGSGSGKTLIANLLFQYYMGNALVLHQDWYYHDFNENPDSDLKCINFDHPSSVDLMKMKTDVLLFKNGCDILINKYDLNLRKRTSEEVIIKCPSTLILDGIFLYHHKGLRDLIQKKFYIHADAELRVLRRINRDLETRNRDIKSVIEQYEKFVRPMHLKYVEPQKKYADYIFDANDEYAEQDYLDRLVGCLNS